MWVSGRNRWVNSETDCLVSLGHSFQWQALIQASKNNPSLRRVCLSEGL